MDVAWSYQCLVYIVAYLYSYIDAQLPDYLDGFFFFKYGTSGGLTIKHMAQNNLYPCRLMAKHPAHP
jgi:hypothetical protein